jgi:hypothetical protein
MKQGEEDDRTIGELIKLARDGDLVARKRLALMAKAWAEWTKEYNEKFGPMVRDFESFIQGSDEAEREQFDEMTYEEFKFFKLGANWAGKHYARALERQRTIFEEKCRLEKDELRQELKRALFPNAYPRKETFRNPIPTDELKAAIEKCTSPGGKTNWTEAGKILKRDPDTVKKQATYRHLLKA